MSDLVTGEAVVLGLRTAKLPSRALAAVIDLVVEFVAFFAVTLLLLAVLDGLDDAASAALVICLMVFFLVGLPVLVETLSRGRSLGKLALGLRVVRTDGGPVRFRHSLVRGLVGVVEVVLLTGVPAVITSLISTDGRRLGDIFGGTVVVRERVPGGRNLAQVPPPPPQVLAALGGDLVRLDFSAVPPGLWLACRQLLVRSGELDASAALRMADQLAADVAARVQWPVPPGLHPALYLGAVLTERQRRDWQRTNEAQLGAVPFGAPPFAPSPFAPPQFAPPQFGVPQFGAPQPPVVAAPMPPSLQQPQSQSQPAAPAPAAEPRDNGGFALPG
ncbi:RDD family protein [Kitasatospora viridis]|uniref:RDD family protein n=1 Tax=Kitasatospora viridis TaxID=281105 RepID=UPI001BA509A7|nr:RDD family protein [Kitasatospora viridis]